MRLAAVRWFLSSNFDGPASIRDSTNTWPVSVRSENLEVILVSLDPSCTAFSLCSFFFYSIVWFSPSNMITHSLTGRHTDTPTVLATKCGCIVCGCSGEAGAAVVLGMVENITIQN